MRFAISEDARPHARTLMLAAVISIALWFVPFADLLVYPFRLFVTFIHEGGHAVAAVLTGNSVAGLSIGISAGGETYSTQGGLVSQIIVSSAGYLGAMAFGALLLVLIRKAVTARFVLIGSAALIALLTLYFGLFQPLFSGSWSMMAGIPFTLIAGTLISLGLFAVAAYSSPRVASFIVSLLAVQCVLNALLDLKTVFFLSSPGVRPVHTDALNMANATGIPALFWAISWIVLAFVILSLAMRFYVVSKNQAEKQRDLPFEDPLKV
jgi:hypothetical protein